MKNFTFFVITLIFPLTILGQSTAHLHRVVTENQKEIEELAGQKVFEATERFFSPEVQSYMVAGKPNKADYLMKLDSLIDRSKETDAENWQNESKNDFVYNEAWQATVINEREWNPDQNDWEITERTELSFNELGQATIIEIHSANDAMKELSPQSRMEVTYDGSDLIDYIEIYEYEEGEWVLQVIQEYDFSAGERLEQIETKVYSEEDEDWTVDMTIRFTYDDDGRRVSSGIYVTIEGETDETLYRLVEYRYDEEGRLSESEESVYDIFEEELVPEYLREYSYYIEENHSTVLEYQWDGQDWKLDHKEETFYDQDVNSSEVAHPYRAFGMLFEWEIEADTDPDLRKFPVEYLESDYIESEDNFRESHQTEYFYSPISDPPEEYTLTYLADENGSIEGESVQTVEHGQDGTEVEAIPDEGYHFVEWSDGLETAKRTDTNVTADLTVTATFAAASHTITATAGDGGSISPSGDVTVTAGEDQAFSIQPDEGYQVEDVLVDNESVGVVDAYTFENVNDNHTIHATFDEEETTYTVTFEVDIGPALEYYDQVEGFEDFDPEEHHILITGEMLGWTEPGTDEDQILEVTNDEEIYSTTFQLTEGTYSYKYFSDAIDDGWDGGEWAGDPNREITVEGDMTVENIFGWPDDPVAVDPVPENIELSLYPNPADSHLRVEASVTIEEIQMLDILGQVVYSSTVGNDNHEISLEGLKKGIYFLQVTTAHGMSTERVQVTR